MKVLRRTFVVLSVLLVSTLALAETSDEPVNRLVAVINGRKIVKE